MKSIIFFSLLICSCLIYAQNAAICPIIRGEIKFIDDGGNNIFLPIENYGQFLKITLFYKDEQGNRINCPGDFIVTNNWKFHASILPECNRHNLLYRQIFLEPEFTYGLPSGWEVIEPYPYIILESDNSEYKITKPFIKKHIITDKERNENFRRAKEVFASSPWDSLIYFMEACSGEDFEYTHLSANFLEQNRKRELNYELLKNKDFENAVIEPKIKIELLFHKALAALPDHHIDEAERNLNAATVIISQNQLDDEYMNSKRAIERGIALSIEDVQQLIIEEVPQPMPYRANNVYSMSSVPPRGIFCKGGFLAAPHNINFIFTQIGAAIPISYRVNLTLSGGAAITLNSEKGKTFALADLLVNFNLEYIYLGGGLGFHSKIKDDWKSGAEMVLNFGINFLERVSLYTEYRTSFLGRSRNMFTLGLRYFFIRK